jgi:Arc/MetJ-type ribon-helix-helix transcriptional regulator
MAKKHKLQVLFKPEQYQKLEEISKQEGISVSEIVRTAVQQWLLEWEKHISIKTGLEALDHIRKHRQAILDRRSGKPLEIDTNEMIKKNREERDDELHYRDNDSLRECA